MILVAQQGQDIFDICLQIGYPIESIYDLIQSNGIDSLNTGNHAQRIITFDEVKIKDVPLFTALKNAGITIATAKEVKPGQAYDESFDESYD